VFSTVYRLSSQDCVESTSVGFSDKYGHKALRYWHG
jgi:hypothetical protein